MRFAAALTREHLVEHQPQRVDVAACRDLAPGLLLRRHVGGRAASQIADRDLFRERGQAEVGDAHLAPAVDHDVGRLQVAMQDPALVRGGESRADLSCELDGFVLRQPADAPQKRAEVLAIDVLHRQEVHALDHADVVDAAHVGM